MLPPPSDFRQTFDLSAVVAATMWQLPFRQFSTAQEATVVLQIGGVRRHACGAISASREPLVYTFRVGMSAAVDETRYWDRLGQRRHGVRNLTRFTGE